MYLVPFVATRLQRQPRAGLDVRPVQLWLVRLVCCAASDGARSAPCTWTAPKTRGCKASTTGYRTRAARDAGIRGEDGEDSATGSRRRPPLDVGIRGGKSAQDCSVRQEKVYYWSNGPVGGGAGRCPNLRVRCLKIRRISARQVENEFGSSRVSKKEANMLPILLGERVGHRTRRVRGQSIIVPASAFCTGG